jgi:peptide/nickel transport system permease protein
MRICLLIIRRLALGLGTLLFISILVFVATQLLPGDAAEVALGQSATPETLAAYRREMSLDRPAPMRYALWLKDFAHGDFGKSSISGRNVSDLIASRLPSTLTVAGLTALISIPLALGFGLYAAARAGSLPDRIITAVSLFTVSGPEFLFATLLVMLFAVQLRWLPATSYLSTNSSFASQARALILPVSTLLISTFGPMTRMTRSAILNVLGAPFVEMALLKGIPRSRILLRHALPNAISPIANVVGISLGYMISGVVVIEVVFSLPGMAKMMVDAVASRDLPLVQGCAIIFCSLYIGLNLITDLIALLCNPRLRAGL